MLPRGTLSAIPRETLALTGLFATSHVFYFALWQYPKLWVRLTQRAGASDPSSAMAAVANVLRFSQGAAFLAWWAKFDVQHEGNVIRALRSAHPCKLIFGGALLAAGQALNAAVLRALKLRGTYYGTKFGHRIEWVTTFPYNTRILKHPQYIGAAMTMLGATTLFGSAAHHAAGLTTFRNAVLCFFVGTALHEQFGGGDGVKPGSE